MLQFYNVSSYICAKAFIYMLSDVKLYLNSVRFPATTVIKIFCFQLEAKIINNIVKSLVFSNSVKAGLCEVSSRAVSLLLQSSGLKHNSIIFFI